MKCLYINACSLVKKGKLDELKCIAAQIEPHIIVVTETWIKNETDVQKLNIPCYTHYNNFRQNRKGGGVSIFVHNNLKHRMIEDHCIADNNHYLWIHLEKQSLDIGAIYNPNKKNVDNFLELYSQQLEKRKRALVFGDYNFDLLVPDKETRKYKDILKENNFTIINKVHRKYSTRVTESTNTIIDHVCTNLKDNNFNFSLIESSMSDHRQIYLEVENHYSKPVQKIYYTAVNYKKLHDSAEHNIRKDESAYEMLEESILKCLSTSKVTKSKYLNPPRQDWITNDIIQDIDKRNEIWHRYKTNKEDIKLEQEFKEARARVYKKIQTTKKTYYFKFFKNHMSKPKKMWKAIHELASNNIKHTAVPDKVILNSKIITDMQEICESFNSYFSTVGSTLASKIPNKYQKVDRNDTQSPNIVKATELTSFVPATVDEIIQIINDLDPNTSSGIDGISTKMIKCIKNIIAIPLTNSINNCLKMGVFPQSLKIAKVTPIFKNGNKSDPCNYRPISVLPVISKIFERVIYSRIEKYLKSKDFLYNKQYGFRPKSNTLSATIDLVTKIKNKIDEKQIVLGVFIDLKKAFDTISHKLLLAKLSNLGITGKAHDIFKSYFQNRRQIVKIGQHQSTPTLMTFGIPQGSILGPLLFLIYVNDIKNLGLKADISLYADDTCLFYYGHSCKTLKLKAQRDLNKLNDWFLSNLLTINTEKTNFVIFAAKNKNLDDIIKLKIDNDELKQKSSEKYLGIILDHYLDFKQHIHKIKTKLTSLSGAVRAASNCLPRKIKYIIYNSLIKPHIDYLIEIWGTAAKSNLEPLQRAQNKFIKTLFNYDYNTPTIKIYTDTKIMNINQTYKYYTCTLIYKILNNKIHTVLTFQKKSQTQRMKLRNANHLVSRAPRTKFGSKNIQFEGVRMYNQLPIEIKEANSLGTFKRKLKSYILENQN